MISLICLILCALSVVESDRRIPVYSPSITVGNTPRPPPAPPLLHPRTRKFRATGRMVETSDGHRKYVVHNDNQTQASNNGSPGGPVHKTEGLSPYPSLKVSFGNEHSKNTSEKILKNNKQEGHQIQIPDTHLTVHHLPIQTPKMGSMQPGLSFALENGHTDQSKSGVAEKSKTFVKKQEQKGNLIQTSQVSRTAQDLPALTSKMVNGNGLSTNRVVFASEQLVKNEVRKGYQIQSPVGYQNRSPTTIASSNRGFNPYFSVFNDMFLRTPPPMTVRSPFPFVNMNYQLPLPISKPMPDYDYSDWSLMYQ